MVPVSFQAPWCGVALGKPSQVSPLLVSSLPSVTQWGGQARLPWGPHDFNSGEGSEKAHAVVPLYSWQIHSETLVDA